MASATLNPNNAALGKLKHFYRCRSELRGAASGFAATELEYLVVLARGVFDLLQEIIASIWKTHVKLNDPTAEKRRKAQSLPETFSKIVLRDKVEVRSTVEIETQFGLPTNMADAYSSCGLFFLDLRNVRDNIVHGGSGISHVFDTERGFCVDPKMRPFCNFGGWLDVHRYNENLVSVLPWVASVVIKTVDACNVLMGELSRSIILPAELAPGYHVFVRGPYNDALLEVLQVAQGRLPWWDSTADADNCPNCGRARRSDYQDRVRMRAYFLWENRSTPTWSDANANWRHAEQVERMAGGSV